MSERETVEFDEFQVSIEELRSLPHAHVAAFAALSFAVTEVNVLRRVFLSQSHEPIGDIFIDDVINTQKLVVIRTWSSKLFEAKDLLDSIIKSGPKKYSLDLISLAQEASKDFVDLTSQEGYQVARDIRHEMSNHYPLSAARKNLPYVHKDALCNFFIHQHGGNDYFPLGEAVMFHGRIHRKWQDLKSVADRRAKFDHWFTWCINATDSLLRAHALFAERLIFKPLGRNTFYTKTFTVPATLVDHPFDRLTPVVFRERTTP
ncbi:MAG: hypothetical protein ACT4N9_11055 [Paracoccaceae bacterium]